MTRIAFLTAILAAACGGGSGTPQTTAITQNTVVPSTWNCSTVTAYLGRSFGTDSFVINDPAPGTYAPIDAAGDSITLASPDSIVWSWESTALIRAIFIRADVPGTPLGDATNQVWLYVPPGDGKYSAGGIYTEDSTNQRYPAKQIEFCFDAPEPPTYALTVTKTAKMAYEKSFGWYLFKVTDPAIESLVLSPGQVIDVGYKVTAGVNAILTDNYSVSGKITIHNPAPVDATITSIADTMEGATGGSMDCGQMLPVILAPGADLVCDYMWTLPNGDDRLNSVTVTTTGDVQGGSATATAFNSEADVTLIDACVAVADDHKGSFGVACYNDTPKSFTYTLQIGPFEACGQFEFTNTATLLTDTTGTQLTASVTLPITVPCEVGCSLTPGYWKTHSKYGPAPYDDTWVNVGEDTAFFLSGKTWYQQFGVSPSGNAYWQLSHQYAAAVLNAFNGASHDVVDAALLEARGLFETYPPAEIGLLRGSSALRAQFVALAATLASYNAGGIGPGHCSE